MADIEVLARLKADASNWVQGYKTAEKSAKQTAQAAQAAGRAADTATRRSSASLMALRTAGVAAGAAALVFAGKSVKAFGDTTASALKLQRVAGGTIEQASKLGGAAKLAGVDQDQFTKSLTLLSRRLVNAKDSAASMQEMTAKLGGGFTDSAGKVKPLAEILPQIADRFKSMENGPEKAALALDLFCRAGTNMLPMLNKGSAGIAELEAKAESLGMMIGTDQVAKFAAYRKAQRENQAAVQGFQIAIGSAVLPVLTAFAEKLQVVASWFGGLSGGVKTATVATIALAGGAALIGPKLVEAAAAFRSFAAAGAAATSLSLGPFTLVIAAVAAAGAAFVIAYKRSESFRAGVDKIVAAVKPLGEAMLPVLASIGEAWLKFAGIMAGIYANVIVNGLLPALKLAADAFAWLKDKIGAAVSPAFIQIINSLKQAWADMQPSLKSLGESFAQVKAAISSAVTEVDRSLASIGGLKGVMAAVGAVAKVVAVVVGGGLLLSIRNFATIVSFSITAVSAVFRLWASNISTAMRVVAPAVRAASTVFQAFSGFVSGAVARARSVVAAAMTAIGAAFRAVAGPVKSVIGVFNNVVSRVVGVVTGFASKIASLGASIAQGFANGIRSGIGAVVSAAMSLADAIPGPIKKLLGIASPSKVTKGFGANVSQGLADGIKKRAGVAKRAAQKMTNDTLAAVRARAIQEARLQRVEDAKVRKMNGKKGHKGDDWKAGQDAVKAEISKQMEAAAQARADAERDAADAARAASEAAMQASEAAAQAAQQHRDKVMQYVDQLRDAVMDYGSVAAVDMNAANDAMKTHAEALAKAENWATKLAQAERDHARAVANGNLYTQARTTRELADAQRELAAAQALAASTATKGVDAGVIIGELRSKVKAAEEYAAAVEKLRQAGLNKGSMDDILKKGVEAGSLIAKALIAGGQSAITEVNQLTMALASSADKIGNTGSNSQFGESWQQNGGGSFTANVQPGAIVIRIEGGSGDPQQIAKAVSVAVEDSFKQLGSAWSSVGSR